ncbi:MAG: hypothetical protein EZS28_044699, partial [Streblomastix strix]
DMNTWMEDQENVAKLAIGDNLYIVDKEVMDYWWDGTALRALETELPDMSNVVTSLGAASGNGNAITDISIDGNTITPAKNDTLVTTGFDQSITGMKTFTIIIISDGGDMSNYVKKTGADILVVNGILRKGEDEREESEDDDDYITKGTYNNATNNIINQQCVRKTGQTTQNVNGRLLYVNPFGIEDNDSQLLTNITYPTWLEVSNTNTSIFSNFYQVLTPQVMFVGYTASQSSLIKINNQKYFFYLVVKPDDTIQAYQGRDICTVNPPPLYTLFRPLNSDYMAMFLNDGYVHFTTQATMKQSSIQVVLFLNYKMSNVYIDEALLDAAGLSEFPELHAYIHEREPKPIIEGIANQIVVGPQYFQDQVKYNDDKLHVQPAPQHIVPIEIPQDEIFKIPKSQLAANCQIIQYWTLFKQ